MEVSARQKKAFLMAVEAGDVTVGELDWWDKGTLVRCHLISSSTPAHSPQGNSRSTAAHMLKEAVSEEGSEPLSERQ